MATDRAVNGPLAVLITVVYIALVWLAASHMIEQQRRARTGRRSQQFLARWLKR